MRVHRIIANVHVADIEEAKDFYSGFLGLSNEDFTLGWVARYSSPGSAATVQLVTGDATATENASISVLASDIDSAYEEAQRLGYEIVHPLTTEPWGVHRFMVRAPDGTVVNLVEHAD
jgi:predicted enzyme related to lactoylglutathione lyase